MIEKNLFIGILLFLAGCTVHPQKDIPEHIRGVKNLAVFSRDTEPTTSIKLVKEATFEAPDKYSLDWYDQTVSFYSWLAGIEIDDAGRVFIADNKATKIHVFSSDGKYLQSIGDKGTGPGEYRGITDTRIVSNKLYVFDFLQFRTTVYSLDSLKVIKAENVKPAVNQGEFDEIKEWLRWRLLIRNDGTYLAGFRKHRLDARVGSPTYNLDKARPKKYYFMNDKSKIISDEIFEIKKLREILVAQVGNRHLSNFRPLPFLGKTIITLSDNDYIYTAWTDDFLIKVYGPKGNYVRAFYYPFEKKPIRREELLSLFHKDNRNRKVVEHAELPKKWPVIYSMITDDQNQLWLSTIVDKAGVREWWVLENTGKLIAKFSWPDNRSIKAVKDGFAYALVTDRETGQQKVVKYRVKMK